MSHVTVPFTIFVDGVVWYGCVALDALSVGAVQAWFAPVQNEAMF
jgi:hypothetical protein